MEAALARGDRRLPRPFGEEPLHEHLLRAAHQRFVRGEVDVLVHAGCTCRTNRGQGAHGRVEPDSVVGLVAVSGERWSSRVAGYGSCAREAFATRSLARSAGMGPSAPWA